MTYHPASGKVDLPIVGAVDIGDLPDGRRRIQGHALPPQPAPADTDACSPPPGSISSMFPPACCDHDLWLHSNSLYADSVLIGCAAAVDTDSVRSRRVARLRPVECFRFDWRAPSRRTDAGGNAAFWYLGNHRAETSGFATLAFRLNLTSPNAVEQKPGTGKSSAELNPRGGISLPLDRVTSVQT